MRIPISSFFDALLTGTAVFWLIIQLYGNIFGYVDALLLNALHVYLATAVIFLLTRKFGPIITLILTLMSYAGILYYYNFFNYIIERMPFVTPVTTLDLVIGIMTIILVLLAAFSLFGWPLTLLTFFFIIYPFIQGGFTLSKLKEFIDLQFLGTQGIFGIPVYVSSAYVFMFMFFAALLQETGVGDDIHDFAMAIVGSKRGGSAKVSVIASSLFGMLSGSATANVVATGSFTIPFMRKTGFDGITAGAVEATASTGGQIMPPVMGAAAFIMAQLIGVRYWDVVTSAWIPAFMYYLTIYFMIDFYAALKGLTGFPKEKLPNLRDAFKRGYTFIIPIILLIMLLAFGYSPSLAAFMACIALLAIGLTRKERRKNLLKVRQIVSISKATAKSAAYVASVCAAAGIVIGSVSQTGLGLKLSGLMVDLSMGNAFLLLILTAIAAIIFGMGMPTSGAYVTAAVLLAPALLSMGFVRMAAHMFIFYFACLSAITPPVALAAYTASGIVHESPIRIGFRACKMGITAFIVPFIFVFYPQLLAIGEPLDIVVKVVFAFISIFPLSAGIMGFSLRRINMFERILHLITAFLILYPETLTSIVGLLLLFGLLFYQRKVKPSVVASTVAKAKQ